LGELYATRHGVELERWAVGFVNRNQGRHAALADFKPSSSLSAEQNAAVNTLLSSKDQVLSLRGVAGAGKTSVISELDQALARSGRIVFYTTPTASAAAILKKEGLASATTLSDFLQNVAKKDPAKLRGAVFVVDEAGMLSNTQGVALFRLSEKHDARVLLIGDSSQHGSVEAGDFLKVLESHSKLERASLTAIRRQTSAVYREAIKLLSSRSTRPGLEILDKLGWLHDGRAQYLDEAAQEFLRKAEYGKALDSVLAVTPTWAENHVLTDSIRAGLKRSGHLHGGESLLVHEPLQWTVPQKKNLDNYSVGQVVRFNKSAEGFRSGEWAEVAAVGDELRLRSSNGRELLADPRSIAPSIEVCTVRSIDLAVGDRLVVRVNARNAGITNGDILTVVGIKNWAIQTKEGPILPTRTFRDFGHGYVLTSPKSQGKTTAHVIVAAETLDTRSAYVACSRGKHSCSVHTPDKVHLLERIRRAERRSALDVLKEVTSERKARALPSLSPRASAIGSRPAAWLGITRERAETFRNVFQLAIAAVWGRGVRQLGDLARNALIPCGDRDYTQEHSRDSDPT
jgi:AAA domain-containing protein